MPRIARIVLPGLPHHLTQRGNNRQDIFFADADRRIYLEHLAEQCSQHHVVLEGYCLMTNHVHLILTPPREDSLAKAVGRAHFLYTQYINHRHGRSGHLWQNRFFSCALDDAHYLAAMRYVERNPVRGKLVRAPWRYAWSSAGRHADEPGGHCAIDGTRWRELADGLNWREFLLESDDMFAHEFRLATSRGRPLATDSLLSKLEAKLGCRLRPRPVGRPRTKSPKIHLRK